MKEYIQKSCLTCGQIFNAAHFVVEGFCDVESSRCDPCILKSEEEREAWTHALRWRDRNQAWREVCPPEFCTLEEGGQTDPRRLDLEQAKLREVMRWQYGRRGLLLLGPTGKCKTRIAWRLLRREFDAGRRVQAVKAHRFGVEAVQRQLNGNFQEWFDELVNVPLLLIDDLGKGKLTEAVESHLFGLIDERTEQGRPIIVTTNSTGKALADRMSEDRGEPIVRRLRDYCDVITLT